MIKLETINKWLLKIGLLLVLCMSEEDRDGPIFFRLIRAKNYPLKPTEISVAR